MESRFELESVRRVLMRQEESIIFAFIERAQFRANTVTYRPGAFGDALGDHSLFGWLLRECETAHARVGRYLSPDEHPFHADLPPSRLSSRYEHIPLQRCRINVNERIRAAYERDMLPLMCAAGDDGEYGSTAVCDVQCVQNLSRRIHYGKFIAESKWQRQREQLEPLVAAGDRASLLAAITDCNVEREVLNRVALKASVYGREPPSEGRSAITWIAPDAVLTIYERWIMPMNKEVQVEYLMSRIGDGEAPAKSEAWKRTRGS